VFVVGVVVFAVAFVVGVVGVGPGSITTAWHEFLRNPRPTITLFDT
jgi:hypothetical protein